MKYCSIELLSLSLPLLWWTGSVPCVRRIGVETRSRSVETLRHRKLDVASGRRTNDNMGQSVLNRVVDPLFSSVVSDHTRLEAVADDRPLGAMPYGGGGGRAPVLYVMSAVFPPRQSA